MLGLLDAIKTIIHKLEDQKYLPLSLHHAKKNFYAFRQGNLPNPDYLDRFMNLVDMEESYDTKLYDQAMFKIAQDSTVYSTTAEADLQDDEIKMIETTAQDIYLACAFVINSDLRRYGRLIEELENDYTKGNDNYPRNMVSFYHIARIIVITLRIVIFQLLNQTSVLPEVEIDDERACEINISSCCFNRLYFVIL